MGNKIFIRKKSNVYNSGVLMNTQIPNKNGMIYASGVIMKPLNIIFEHNENNFVACSGVWKHDTKKMSDGGIFFRHKQGENIREKNNTNWDIHIDAEFI